LELKDIKAIIDLMRKNELSVFEMEKEGFRLKLQKGPEKQTVFSAPVLPQMLAAPVAAAPSVTPGAPAAAPSSEVAPSTETTKEIISPMVGTFYRAASPESPPFIDVGQEVNEDTVVICQLGIGH
jgi:acetyl-CoA carboxylase biotin carboxyl carrier protein